MLNVEDFAHDPAKASVSLTPTVSQTQLDLVLLTNYRFRIEHLVGRCMLQEINPTQLEARYTKTI